MNKAILFRYIRKILLSFGIILAVIVFMFPIVWIILGSFKTDAQLFAPHPVLIGTTLDHYNYAIKVFNLGFHFMNSVIVVSSTVVLTTFISILAGYSLARFRFRGDKRIASWILSMRMFPPIAAALPLYFMMTKIGLFDTQLALILTYTAFNLPLTVWFMRSFFVELPKEIEEAAYIDGCSKMGTLIKVVLPISRPGIIATATLSFLFSWSEFLFGIMLTVNRATTLPVGAALIQRTVTAIPWGEIFAAATIMIIPALAFAMCVYKQFVKGLTMGAVKG